MLLILNYDNLLRSHNIKLDFIHILIELQCLGSGWPAEKWKFFLLNLAMDVPNIAEFGRAWWDQARKKMKNSLVYLDAVTCECLHWNGGVASIFEAGATAIRELSAFEVGQN